MLLNLDPAAAERLRLDLGSVLDLEVSGRRFTMVYLPEQAQFHPNLLGSDRMLAAVAAERDLLITWMTTCHSNRRPYPKVLGGPLFNEGAPVPKAWQDSWRKARAILRPQRLPQPDAVATWRKVDLGIEAEMMFAGGRNMSISVDAAGLRAIHAMPGDVLLLEIAGQTLRCRLLADATAATVAHLEVRETPKAKRLIDQWFEDGAPAEQQRALAEKVRAAMTGDTPYIIHSDVHWALRTAILVVQPAIPDMEAIGLKPTLDIAAKPGAQVKLRKLPKG